MINLPPFGQVQAYASHGAILAYGYSGSTPFVVERYLNPGQLRAFEAEQAHQVGRLPKGLAIPNCVAFLLEPGMAIKKAQRPLSITGPGVNGNVLTLPSRTETLQIAGRT